MKRFYSLTILSLLLLTSCMDLAPQYHSKNEALQGQHRKYAKGEVYTMRGIGGIFSTGMNRLENKLERDYQIRTSSTIWYKFNTLSDFITEHYKSKELRGPIILIGHSLGANEQIKVAKNLYYKNIPVELLITVDAVAPIRVPPNVKHVLNIYKPSFVPMFSGLKLKALDPKHTYIENFDVTALENIYVNHFTIDKHKEIQTIMLKEILSTLKVHTTV